LSEAAVSNSSDECYEIASSTVQECATQEEIQDEDEAAPAAEQVKYYFDWAAFKAMRLYPSGAIVPSVTMRAGPNSFAVCVFEDGTEFHTEVPNMDLAIRFGIQKKPAGKAACKRPAAHIKSLWDHIHDSDVDNEPAENKEKKEEPQEEEEEEGKEEEEEEEEENAAEDPIVEVASADPQAEAACVLPEGYKWQRYKTAIGISSRGPGGRQLFQVVHVESEKATEKIALRALQALINGMPIEEVKVNIKQWRYESS